MTTQAVNQNLGQHILVVVDGTPGLFDALRRAIAALPQINHRFFTVFCCCPPQYWEHGGADNPEVRHQIAHVWQQEEADFDRADHCLRTARSILEDAGIPSGSIRTRIATEDSLIAAIMAELKREQYSGVILNRDHHDVVNRLNKKGITDVFRKIPEVNVWTLDVERK